MTWEQVSKYRCSASCLHKALCLSSQQRQSPELDGVVWQDGPHAVHTVRRHQHLGGSALHDRHAKGSGIQERSPCLNRVLHITRLLDLQCTNNGGRVSVISRWGS